MNFFTKLSSLGFSSWLLIFAITGFLYLALSVVLRSRSELVHKRIESLEIFTNGTEEQKIMQQSVMKRIYMMFEERLVRHLDKYVKGGRMRPLKLKLIQANDHVTEPIQHWAKKIILGAVMAFVGLLVFKTKVPMIVMFGALGVYYPDYKLKENINKRQLKIKAELPDFLDLLAATAPSAKNLEDAIRKVCERMEGEVTLEFRRALEEMNAGRKQRDALKDFSIRCGIQEINTLVSQINQAEVFGTGVEKTLLVQAEKIRKLKKVLAEIKARKASITLLLPSMFLLVTVMIMIAGPNVVQFMDAMTMF
jgi:tight adherence protein C